MSDAVAAAYSDTGAAWAAGPARIYDRLADTLIERSPLALRGRAVLDIGAGTGAASRAALRKGAQPIAVDPALGMLMTDAEHRPPAVLGDAVALPFAARSFDLAVAAFSLNHLVDPAAGLREAARVVRDGGAIVASAYAADDHHPVKEATEQAAVRRGWSAPAWYRALRVDAIPRLATVERAQEVAVAAGLHDVTVDAVHVAFPELEPRDLVAWRMGMAQIAPFVAALRADERAAMAEEALEAMGPEPAPLERSLIVLVSRN